MDVLIKFEGSIKPVDSLLLKEIGEKIVQDCNQRVKYDKSNEVGVKDGGLITGLTIAGFAMTAISTFITILQYFQNRNPEHDITIINDENEIVLRESKRSQEDITLKELISKNTSSRIQIRIKRN